MGVFRTLRGAGAGLLFLTVALVGCGQPGPSVPASSSASPEPGFAAGLRPALVAKMEQMQVPGAIVLVDIPGQGQWLAALGVGDLATKAPMRADNHMRVGSVTKTMTASLVLQLVDEGRVGLDDPVARFVPEVPNGANITVRQLLNMTSGLADYLADEGLLRELDAHHDRVWTSAELLAYAFAQPPNVPPGQKYEYINTNYVLLGIIAQKVTGQGLTQLFQQRLFDKLGMTNTSFPDPADASLPQPYAHGYDFFTNMEFDRALKAFQATNTQAPFITASPGAQPADTTMWNTSWAWAAGAGISTVADLKIWAKEVATGTLLKPDTQRQRLDFQGRPYGLGIEEFSQSVGHGGFLPGYQTHMAYFPDKQATLIVLTNLETAPNVVPATDFVTAVTLAQIIRKQLFP
jgi:D-alanyl-D-alanine carboxypeptidase